VENGSSDVDEQLVFTRLLPVILAEQACDKQPTTSLGNSYIRAISGQWIFFTEFGLLDYEK